MLTMLPDLVLPITHKQCDGLMDNAVQLNILDAGLNDRLQRSLDIVLETYELKAMTNGKVDYTGPEGRRRLLEAAMAFVGDGNPLITREGDLRAAHLAINFNNTQAKLFAAGMPLLPWTMVELLPQAMQMSVLPPETETRMALFLSYFQKKPKF